MEHSTKILTALSVVEWHGTLRHLETVRAGGGDVPDVLIDLLVGELDGLARTWADVQSLNPGSTLDEVESNARSFLTEHIADVNQLLAPQEGERDAG